MATRVKKQAAAIEGPKAKHVALLRGVNVGGKNKLPMADLAAIFGRVGCDEVRTYIQSGNVVFRATEALAAEAPSLVQAEIEARLGLKVPVVLRSAEQMARVVRDNPFLAAGEDEASLHVVFLAAEPTAAQVASLDPNRSPPDRYLVSGREIYLCCPNGLADTKLSNAYFDSRLGTVSTGRNWRTVLKLVEMAGG